MAAKVEKQTEIFISKIGLQTINFCILGRTPLVYNKMSTKAIHELLYPKEKTKADRQTTIKHNPLEEYRASLYTHQAGAATRLFFPAPGFKGTMRNAILRLPGTGTSKTEIGQLVWVEGSKIDIFGEPQLYMTGVRSAGMNRTPDIRTRGIVPEWACRVSVTFMTPRLTALGIHELISAGGMLSGIGDFRVEKGAGNFGQFEVVDTDNSEFLRRMQIGADAQERAIDAPSFYDLESEELFTWFANELNARGRS